MQWFDKVLLIGISILLVGGITAWIGFIAMILDKHRGW